MPSTVLMKRMPSKTRWHASCCGCSGPFPGLTLAGLILPPLQGSSLGVVGLGLDPTLAKLSGSSKP